MAKSTDRRRSADIRPLLVRAAADEFTEKGFASATVTDIAQRADVAPSVLYRHFASKAELFKAAVISPLLEAMDDFRTSWSQQRTRPFSSTQLWLVFIDDLYRNFSKHRHGLTAFISAGDQLDEGVEAEIQEVMDMLFRELISIGETEARQRGIAGDVDLRVRLVVTLVAGATTLGPLTLRTADGPIDQAQLVTGIRDLTLFGLQGAPHPIGTSPPSDAGTHRRARGTRARTRSTG